MIKYLKLVVLLLLFIFSVNTVFAFKECEDKKACMNMPPDMMMHKDQKQCMDCMKIQMLIKHAGDIGLTEEQIGKLNEIEVNCKKDKIKKQAEIETLNIDKHTLMKKEEVDLAEVKNIIQKIANIESEMEYNCLENSVKAKKILSDEQKKKIQEMMKEKHEIMKDKKDNGKKHEGHEHGK